MSIFDTMTLNCPACSKPMEFDVVASVNADRRPDLREEIIAESFQGKVCPACKAEFRLDPQMVYFHVAKGLWISVYPVSRLPDWPQLEQQAKTTFALAFGDRAPGAARQIGRTMKPRLTFGWAGLREKVIAADYQLDDVALEMAKSLLFRTLDRPPLSPGTEVRLVALAGDNMEFGWLELVTGKVVEILTVPRALYDGIVKDPKPWEPLRNDLTEGLYVDVFRLYVVPAAAAAG